MSSISLTKNKSDFYENAVVNALCKMTKGYLQLTLPSGEILEIGQRDSVVKADLSIKNHRFF